ncbi:MAG TPA: adenylate/guanylate cyclase domain-containing protein [Actinomycetota bacterium]|nr:adenylate/guanylate cyclase domain-containing protein [Actinomycetota bacterium]
MPCSVCGQPLPEGARFCPNCGAVVGAPLGTDELKMVTVLFADLVDSTGLARRLEPERAREIQGRFFDAATQELQALRGRPEKFIGDAVMAVFGLPTVHEDDALRAVRAGLAIRGRLRRMSVDLGLAEPLQVRVGIESGRAATGIGPVGQLLVTGPVVNAAARLQTAASPGEVLAGDTTFALTADAVSFGDRRDVPAKGFDEGLVGFPVEGLAGRSARRTIPFVGRSSELAILRESLNRAATYGRPVLVTVVGEPGIGKTRLADELVAGLGDDVMVLAGRSLSFADTATFAPAAAIVSELAGLEEEDPPEKARRRLRELVETAGLTDVDRTVERLSLLFGMAERRDESAFVSDVQAAFVPLIDGLTRERSAVLVFDDAAGLHPPMLALIGRLGATPRHGPRRAMILVLTRPELLDERSTWGTDTANATLLRLDPLSTEESVTLVRQAADGGIDDAEATEIAARADGNPFFIIETTGMLQRGDGGTASPRPVRPPTVQALVSARIDVLPPRLRQLARAASAFFVSFDLEELHTIDPEAAEEELRQLEDAEIVVREERRRGPQRWRLRHATVKDVAYASLPKRERVRLHQLIADHLLAAGRHVWAADHLELAALASLDLDPDDRTVAERAADALVTGGNRARRRMESRTAVDLYERALALAGPEDRWGVREARALAGIGEARYWLGEYPAATQALDAAVRLGTKLDDPFTLALALRFLGDIAINVDADVDRAERLLDGSLAAAERLDEPWALARTLLFAGWVPWTRRHHEEAGAIWRRAFEVADPDDGWARARALNSLSINRTGGPEREGPARDAALAEALAMSNEAMSVAEATGDQFSIAVTTVQRGRVLEDQGRYEETLPCFDRAIAVFEDLGARWELGDALAERGIVKRELGRLDEADEDLRAAVRISEELGERQLAGWTWRALAEVSERRGDHAQAEIQRRRSREAEEQRPR